MDGATPGRQPRESIPDPVAPPHHTQWVQPVREWDGSERRKQVRREWGWIHRGMEVERRSRSDRRDYEGEPDLLAALNEFEEVVAARARYCYPHQHANPSNPGDAAMAAHLAIRRHAARRRVLEIANG